MRQLFLPCGGNLAFDRFRLYGKMTMAKKGSGSICTLAGYERSKRLAPKIEPESFSLLILWRLRIFHAQPFVLCEEQRLIFL